MVILNLSESLAKPLVMAKLNMAYLSSLKNRAKLLLSSLPVSPSRVLRAPSTSSYHLVPKHLRATWSRPEQSHLLLIREASVDLLLLGPLSRLRTGCGSMPQRRWLTTQHSINDSLTHLCLASPNGDSRFELKLQKNSGTNGLMLVLG